MQWYLTKLIYSIMHGNNSTTAKFDEQLRLIQAEDALHALIKARQLGHQQADAYLPVNNTAYKFIDVAKIQLLSQVNDGTAVYNTISEPTDATAFIKSTYLSAADLMDNYSKIAF